MSISFAYYLISAIAASIAVSYFLNKYYIKKFSDMFIIIPRKTKLKKARKRYLVFQIATLSDIDPGLLENAIREKFKELFGLTNLADSHIKLIYFDNKTKKGIIRIKHVYMDHLITTIALLRKLEKENILIIPIKTSGTINKARKLLY